MPSLGTIWGIARAEARLTRRLVRFWIPVVIGLLVAAFQFANFMFIYKIFSFGSASAASANPRFFLANAAGGFLIVFYLGLIFLAMELRARDERERVSGVLDAKPVSNVELVFGRALGLLMPTWIALAVIVGLLALVGYLMKVPIHGPSILTTLIFYTIPVFVFLIGLVYATTMLLRNRLFGAIGSLILIVGTFIAALYLPFWTVPVTDSMGGNIVLFPSDLIPSVIGPVAALQRLGYLVMGLGLIMLAIARHPRRDEGKPALRAAIGGGLLVFGLGICAMIMLQWHGGVKQQEAWLVEHERQLGRELPDVQSIRGDVVVEPGKRLALDLEMQIAARDGGLDRALFSLNPGITVDAVRVDGSNASFTHDDGLLDVELPNDLNVGEQATIELTAAGELNRWFAYLDAAKSPYTQRLLEAQIIFLGSDAMIWDKRYVALMPGSYWLPQPGPDVARGTEENPVDFYEIDLTVQGPDDWRFAGPGRREDLGGGKARFAPGAPLPEVCLIGSDFESAAVEIDGVMVEALLSSKHQKSVEYFNDASEELQKRMRERLQEASDAGLPYPYNGLTMVEVPIGLRGYGGGWRMDTTLIQPAMVLTRENSFPTAWFHGDRMTRTVERTAEREGGEPQAKRLLLETFFENDFNGGNLFLATSRSFLGYQTQGFGPEGLVMDYVLEQLASETLFERKGFFSVHFFKGNFGQQFAEAGQSMQSDDRLSNSYADALIDRITSTNKNWDAMTAVSLRDLEPAEDPEQTLNILALKGGAMAKSFVDQLGRQKTTQFLAALREQTQGRNYTREDLVAAGDVVGEDIGAWLDLWIDQTDLPGFQARDLEYERLQDDATGGPQYQFNVTLLNGEAATGLVRVEYRTLDEDGDPRRRERSEPILIAGNSAVEYGIVLSEPLHSVRVFPYLSLNRSPFNLSLPVLDEERLSSDEPWEGVRPIELEAEDDGSLIVDDLDEMFEVASSGKKGLRAKSKNSDEDLDGGLPIVASERMPSRWSRLKYNDAFGEYRRTLAIVRAGQGDKMATFETEVPKAGRWELSFYLPSKQRFGLMRESRERGSWKLLLDDGSGEREIEFDAADADSGWNSLGMFEVASGTVRVSVTDETDGEYVVADAIRWTPERSNP